MSAKENCLLKFIITTQGGTLKVLLYTIQVVKLLFYEFSHICPNPFRIFKHFISKFMVSYRDLYREVCFISNTLYFAI